MGMDGVSCVTWMVNELSSLSGRSIMLGWQQWVGMYGGLRGVVYYHAKYAW